MNVVDIYSKRQKRLRGEVPDVYQYDTISEQLRVQVVHIVKDALGEPYFNQAWGEWVYDGVSDAYHFIYTTLCREYGSFDLDDDTDGSYRSVVDFFLKTEDIEKAIDVIELSFQSIDPNVYGYKVKTSPNEAIDELNHRFREHGVGYQYESGQIIRVDSEFIHSEAMKPAMKMLSDPIYEGANAEFLSAHKHYRAGENKECLNDCLKSFESCLKSICDRWSWEYKERDTANRLIKLVFDKGLIQSFMESHFSGLISGLKSTLESGVPTVRNKLASHGQGRKIIEVPEHIAAYALHLTASNILLLANADAEKWEQLEDDIPF